MGSTTHKGNVDLLNPEQQNFLSSILGGGNAQQAGQAFSNFLQPYDPQQMQDLFQKSFIDPSKQALERDIVPAIKEQFLGMDESGSSALNQALAQSATDLSTALGSQYMNQYNQNQSNQLQALGLLGNQASQRTFEPFFQQRDGILGALIKAAGMAAGTAM